MCHFFWWFILRLEEPGVLNRATRMGLVAWGGGDPVIMLDPTKQRNHGLQKGRDAAIYKRPTPCGGWVGGRPSQPKKGCGRRGWLGGKRQKNCLRERKCKQKLKRGSTSVCKGGAQEYCNRIWVSILRPGLALPRRQNTLILSLPANPPHPTQPLPWCHPETRWLWCQQGTRRVETES